MNILVVDDDLPVLNAVEIVLKKRGHIIIKAGNAKQALSLLDRLHIDFIISDVSMPDMDGIRFLQLIRKRQQKIPILMLSALKDATVVKNAVESGANGYLAKPFESEDLVRKVESIANRMLNVA